MTDLQEQEFNFLNELVRKSVHLSVLVIPFGYHVLKIELWFIRLALFGVLLFFIPMELYRLKINPKTWLNFITRKAEKDEPANYVLTTLIWLIVLIGVEWLYPMEIAELALVATVLGDSAAALIGKGIGKHRLPYTEGKTIEGYIGGVIFTYSIGWVFLYLIGSASFFLPFLPAVTIAFFDFFEDLPFWAADNLFHPMITLGLAYLLILLRVINV
jgi:dolichol kinase